MISSNPAEGAKLAASSLPISLKYNSKLDQSRSLLKLIGPDQQVQVLKIDTSAPANELAARAAQLKPGAYDLHWQALAEDGHLTLGDVHVTV